MAAPADTAGVSAAPARYALTQPASALLRLALALLGGAALAGAFAPLNLWPLAILSPALLMWLWQDATPREAARLGFCFNFATFAAGTYWLYISIHVFGNAPIWLALFLMLGLVAIMGLYHAALGYAVARWLPQRGAVRWLLALPAAWLLVEWWRGWFLSGFSWLSLGYSQSDTWLAGFAPHHRGLRHQRAAAHLRRRAGCARLRRPARAHHRRLRTARALGSGCGAVSPLLDERLGSPRSRWRWCRGRSRRMRSGRRATATPRSPSTSRSPSRCWRRRACGSSSGPSPPPPTWPTISCPTSPTSTAKRTPMARRWCSECCAPSARPGEDTTRYFNSVLALDDKVSWYDKHHLVPFAEFFPVPQFVRGWMRLMSLPYSDFTRGPAEQPPLPAAHLQLGTTVCYEDAYGSSMLSVLPRADALVNVTNDAWFGHSSARYQHFQIARMRALEAGRYLVRAANDGVSAVIGPHGEVIARAPEFRPVALVSSIVPYSGLTPYARVGNWLVVSLATLALAYGLWVRNDRGRRRREQAGGSVPMTAKLDMNCVTPLQRAVAVCAIAIALAACSRDLSAQSAAAATAPAAAAVAAAAQPGADPAAAATAPRRPPSRWCARCRISRSWSIATGLRW